MWKRWKSRVEQFRQLRQECGILLVVQIFLFAAALPLLCRIRLPLLLEYLAPSRPRRTVDAAKAERIRGSVDPVLEMGKPITRPRCLTRTLTYFFFLTRAGVDLGVSFGMRRRNGEYLGHCWLTLDGAPYLEEEDPRPLYVETYAYPSRKEAEGERVGKQAAS